MKYILSFVGVIAIVCGICFCKDLGGSEQSEKEYIRIHITANSSSEKDERVKYEVKDEIVAFLTVLLEDVSSKSVAEEKVAKNLSNVCKVADDVLEKQNLSYRSSAKMTNEEVPLRAYDNLTLAEGEYACLNLTLGRGEGDNWWCVVFPTVCFYQKNSGYVEYKSKFLDMIKNA